MGKFESARLLSPLRRSLAAVVVALVVMVWSVPGHAVILRPTDDASIDASDPGAVVTNTRTLFAREVGQGEKYTLIRVDLSPLPPGVAGDDAPPAVSLNGLV
jgi:hypothetical protein